LFAVCQLPLYERSGVELLKDELLNHLVCPSVISCHYTVLWISRGQASKKLLQGCSWN